MFPSEEAGNYFNEKYVFLKYEVDLDDPENICKNYGVTAYPTFIFMNGDGEQLSRMLGGSGDTKTFIANVDDLMNPENWFSARYDRFKKDPTYAMKYFKFLEDDCRMKGEALSLLREFVETRSAAEVFSEDNLKLLFATMTSVDAPAYQAMVKNADEVSAVMGKEKYNTAMQIQGERLFFNHMFGVDPNEADLDRLVECVKNKTIVRSSFIDFILQNRAHFKNSNYESLIESAHKLLEDGNFASRKNILRSISFTIPPSEMKVYENKLNALYETALKYEKDPEGRTVFQEKVNSFKQK